MKRKGHKDMNTNINNINDNPDAKNVTISITGSITNAQEPGDSFELMTDGQYFQKGSSSTFSYVESELTGFDGLKTTFAVEPGLVVLRRADGQTADMIFSENQKHHFLYETPFGAVTMGIDTHSIKNNLHARGGNLEIRYDIEVDNVAVSRNSFKINIYTPQ
jgi:uncharacterized beta-barrel protein YwiB (DUF1934 family)